MGEKGNWVHLNWIRCEAKSKHLKLCLSWQEREDFVQVGSLSSLLDVAEVIPYSTWLRSQGDNDVPERLTSKCDNTSSTHLMLQTNKKRSFHLTCCVTPVLGRKSHFSSSSHQASSSKKKILPTLSPLTDLVILRVMAQWECRAFCREETNWAVTQLASLWSSPQCVCVHACVC